MYRIALIFGPPFVYLPIGQGRFMYTGHWSTALPFVTLLDLQLDTTDPIPIPTANLRFSLTFTHTHTHKHTRNCSPPRWPENEGDSAHSGWKGSHITVKCKIMTCQAEKQYRSSPNAMSLNHKCSALLNAPSQKPTHLPGAQNWLCGIMIWISDPMSVTNGGRWAFELQRNCTRHTTASENT